MSPPASHPNVALASTRFTIATPHRSHTSLFASAFHEASQATDTDSLHNALAMGTEKLQDMELFDAVAVKVHTQRDEAHVVIGVKEKGVPFLRSGAYVDAKNGSPGCDLSFALRNPSGYGERITASYSNNVHATQSAANITLPPMLGGATIGYHDRQDVTQNSFTTASRSFQVAFPSFSTSSTLRHDVSITAAIRDEIPTSSTTTIVAPYVLNHLTTSTKLAVRYANTYCKPHHLLTNTIEAALPFGSAKYLKYEANYNYNRSLPLSVPVTFSTSIFYGTMTPLSAVIPQLQPTPVHLCDRYYAVAGTPNSLRGFATNGYGDRCLLPTADIYSSTTTGGYSKAHAIVSLATPLAYGLDAFIFANGGAIGGSLWPLAPLASITSTPSSLLNSVRAAAGAGLALNVGVAKLELTYSIPLIRAANDVIKPFQLGIGMCIGKE